MFPRTTSVYECACWHKSGPPNRTNGPITSPVASRHYQDACPRAKVELAQVICSCFANSIRLGGSRSGV